MRELMKQAIEIGRKSIRLGETASYIPELGRVNKNQLGISIFTTDGVRESVGMPTYVLQSRVFPK